MNFTTERPGAPYFRVLDGLCRTHGCRAAAGDFLDSELSDNYFREYRRGTGYMPKRWAFHSYTDGNRRQTRRVDEFLKATRARQQGVKSPDIWLTEQGALRLRKVDGGFRLQNAQAASGDLRHLVDTVARRSSRIKRFYYYQWRGNRTNWDSGLVNARRPYTRREVYNILIRKTRP